MHPKEVPACRFTDIFRIIIVVSDYPCYNGLGIFARRRFAPQSVLYHTQKPQKKGREHMRGKTNKMRIGVAVLSLAAAMAFSTPAYEGGYQVQAAETVAEQADVSRTSHSSAKNGMSLGGDGYYYYYKNGRISKAKGWFSVSDGLTFKFDKAHRARYKVKTSGSKTVVSKYNVASGKFEAYQKKAIKLDDGKLHYAGAKGVLSESEGTVSDGKGTTYILDSDGVVTAKLVKKGDVRKYYTYNSRSEKWTIVKDRYKTIDNVLYYFSAKSGTATRMFYKNTSRYYKYSSADGSMKLVRKDISDINGNGIYYFDGNGKRVTTSGWYTLSGAQKVTTKVYVSAKGYVTAKMTVSGSVRKYYTYDYGKSEWKINKSKWVSIEKADYYLGESGMVKYVYNKNTKKLTRYSGGKFVGVRRELVKLSDGKMYYFGPKAVKISKAGWYSKSDTEKIRVGNKGYVTMKFSTKTGKLQKYNYSKKTWELMKVSSYKIAGKTYYFGSNGVILKRTISGNKKTGYFYVDETGCKVKSKEIQMAVDLVESLTNDGMTKEEKLKTCYYYLASPINYPYIRDYVEPTEASKFSELAVDMLTNHHGNCYRCAASFSCVATVLGYEARVTCGKVTNLQGTGFTIHGWAELWSDTDKEWIVYDVSMQRNYGSARNYYHVYLKDYYPTHRVIGPRARLRVKNGKVTWRWLEDSELNKKY